jgi:hypothetical protein
MLIDPYAEHCLSQLDAWADALDAGADSGNAGTGATGTGAALYLLVDGVFIPGFHRKVSMALGDSALLTRLFDALPSCNDATRDVSPFLFRYDRSNERMKRLLDQCSGWPMLSAIATSEAEAKLTERLGAWCVVEVDEHHFNFRFPDTRRLPGIFATLTPVQRQQLTGAASRFSYIGRDGKWSDLPVVASEVDIVDRPALDEQQFAALLADSEADEFLLLLAQRGFTTTVPHSICYRRVACALKVAANVSLDQSSKLDWCTSLLAAGATTDDVPTRATLNEWLGSNG